MNGNLCLHEVGQTNSFMFIVTPFENSFKWDNSEKEKKTVIQNT